MQRVEIGDSYVGEDAEAALENGAVGTPKVADVMAARHAPADPFFTPA